MNVLMIGAERFAGRLLRQLPHAEHPWIVHRRALVWITMLACAVGIRLIVARVLPFTNDEGSYLYDARSLLEGVLPGGDALVKAPMAILAFMVGVSLSSGSLFAARAVSVLSAIILMSSLFFLGRALFGLRAATTAMVLWLFTPLAIVVGVLGVTEPLATSLGILALALLARSHPLRRTDVLAGIFLGAGFGARKTVLLLLPAALLLIREPAVSARWRRTAALAVGLAVSMGTIAIWVARLDGTAGVADFAGAGLVAVIRTTLRHTDDARAWVRGPLRSGALVAAKLSLPLLVAGVLAVGLAIAAYARKGSRVLRWITTDERTRFLCVWLGALFVSYTLWPVFLVEYAFEFLPPLALLGGWGLSRFARDNHRMVAVGAWLGVGVALGISCVLTFLRPPLGSFTPEAVREAATVLQKHVPRDEPVFTGAVIVPYLSGHRALFDIAHPMWYRFPFISAARHVRFLPPLAEVEQAVRFRVQWVLVDQITDFAYLRHPSNLLEFIWKKFSFIQKIPNDTGFRRNPLYLWKRPPTM